MKLIARVHCMHCGRPPEIVSILTATPDVEGISPADIDKIVCEWSVENRIPLTEEKLNDLVDRLSTLLGAAL